MVLSPRGGGGRGLFGSAMGLLGTSALGVGNRAVRSGLDDFYTSVSGCIPSFNNFDCKNKTIRHDKKAWLVPSVLHLSVSDSWIGRHYYLVS